MTLVYFGIALGVVVIISELWRRLVRALDQPLSDFDLYCSSLDQELDELEARRRTRPTGNCNVIYGPWGPEDPTLPPPFGPFDRSGDAA